MSYGAKGLGQGVSLCPLRICILKLRGSEFKGAKFKSLAMVSLGIAVNEFS